MKKRGRRGFFSSIASLVYQTCWVWNKCNSSRKSHACINVFHEVHQFIYKTPKFSSFIFPLFIPKVNLRLSYNYDWIRRHKDTRRFLQSGVARRPPHKQLPEASLSLQAPSVRQFPPMIDSWKRAFFGGEGRHPGLVLSSQIVVLVEQIVHKCWCNIMRIEDKETPQPIQQNKLIYSIDTRLFASSRVVDVLQDHVQRIILEFWPIIANLTPLGAKRSELGLGESIWRTRYVHHWIYSIRTFDPGL